MTNLMSQSFAAAQWGTASYDAPSNTATVTQGFAYATAVTGTLGGNATVTVTFAIDGHSVSWTSPSIGGSTAFLLRDPSTNLYYVFSNTALNVGDTLAFAGQSVDQFGPPCFVSGTRIATPDGARLVETLAAGDLVTTAGRTGPVTRRIIWTGRRRIDLAGHPQPDAVVPIRIRAGALGPGLPIRDLLLAPDHAVFVPRGFGRIAADALVPAYLLVNGATVLREPARGRVTYLHVELDTHDVLYADDLPCESYLDTGNRGAFGRQHDAHVAAGATPRSWERDACATLVAAGPDLAAIRAALHRRALALGHRLRQGAALAVSSGSAELARRPLRRGRHVFALPPGLRALRVQTAQFAPADVEPESDDRRRLGVMITGIRLLHGTRAVPIDLRGRVPQTGFYPPEGGGGWRWTDGDALLDLPAAIRFDGIEITIARCMRGWCPPTRPPALAPARSPAFPPVRASLPGAA